MLNTLNRNTILSTLTRAFAIVLVVIFVSSCTSEYEQWVSKELSTGVRNDNLILGIYFGMTKNDFFQHCLELNRQNTITNGPENSTAEITKNGFNEEIAINFYPDFEQDKIHIFRMYFNYKQWSPWNKEFHSDKLLPIAVAYLSKTFNTTFKEMKTPKGKPFWLSIEGNRQIRTYIKDDRTVNTDISDLTITAKNPALQPNHPRVTQ